MWFKSAEERIKYLLNELAEDHGIETQNGIEIRLRLKHHEIASLAATTRQTATTILNLLVKQNLIEYNRQRIIIKRSFAKTL
ncbi:MAG: helix-turn-helix domain-containing protein [Draconibacterium sp.]|nr:helix-turn-helix domain-containing protein [Draconibacterium sp.]